MGFCLAEAAIQAGHRTTLITAPTNLTPPKKVKTVKVETSQEMFQAVKDCFESCDCLVMAAAVSDYKPAKKSKTKIKKEKSELTIKLKPTKDILKWAGVKNKGLKDKKIIAGFALEDENIRKNAEQKLKAKNLDMIIANGPEAIGAACSSVQIKTAQTKWITQPKATKRTVAKKIIHLIENLCPVD
jgi:phosphopantothenoylcysteine decarboxylase / phosphopantothenate---cysteine ligase